MTRALVPTADALPVTVEELAERARDYAAHARAENTARAYASDMKHFETWCSARGVPAMPTTAGVLTAYVTEFAPTLAVSTLRRRLSAIREANRLAGHPVDTSAGAFRDVWAGIRRKHGRPAAAKDALITVELRQAVEALPDTLIGLRDRALLLVGFAGALRRSELVALDVGADAETSITETAEGLVIRLGRSKTDQSGQGVAIGVPYGSNPATCPVRAWRAWTEAAEITTGPAFRSVDRHGNVGADRLTDRAVAMIVQRSVERGAIKAGLSPEAAAEKAKAFAGHSLRSGLATSAAANDAPGHLVQRHLRHAKFDTTARYIKAGEMFRKNAAGMAGL